MATTSKGIYYPNDYTKVADVPADMKALAKSVDTVIDDINNDINLANRNLANVIQLAMTNQKNIDTEHETNTQQDKDIANLKTENEELKAENERLNQDLNALPSNTAEGEYITLTDSADSRFNKFKVLGKSTQKTRSGKNILYVADKEETINNMGITYSVKNGIITLNGTSTGSHYITFTNSLFNINEGDYTISTKVLSGSYSGSVGKQVNIDFSKKLFDGGYIDDTVTVEVQNQQENVYLAFYIGSNAIFNNYQIIIQLEEGSVATEIEQYGAMPSPKFISPINNIEGSINLFDKKKKKGSINYDSGLNEENENRTRSKNYIELPSNILKFKVIRTIVGNEFWIRFYDKDKKYLGYDSANGNYNKAQILQFNVLENTKYIRFVDLTNNLSNKIKITVDLLSYKYTEPNKGIIFIKNTCKNLINQDEIGNYNSGISYISTLDDNSKKTTANLSNSRDAGTFLKLKKNTQYIVSLDIISITTENGSVKGAVEIMGHKFNTDTNIFGTLFKQTTITSASIGQRFSTTFNSGDYDFWTLHISGWYGQGNLGVLVYKDVQVEPEATATDFVDGSQEFEFPLTEGQVLHEEDYLADDGIHNKRITIVLDGTESSWAVNTNATNEGYSHFRYNNYPNLNVESSSTALLCSHFKRGPIDNENYINDTSGSNILYFGIDNNIIGVTDSDDNNAKLTKWKNWLAEQYANGTPVTVETRLKEETITPYTDEQKQVYDEIVKTAKTYKTVTNIFSTNEISPKFEVNYRRDIDTYIDNKLANVNEQILNIAGGN